MKAGCLSTSTSESVQQNMTHGFIEEKVLNIVEKCSRCAAEISFKKVLSISNNPSDCGYKQGVLSLSLFNRFKAEGMESTSDIWNKNGECHVESEFIVTGSKAVLWSWQYLRVYKRPSRQAK